MFTNSTHIYFSITGVHYEICRNYFRVENDMQTILEKVLTDNAVFVSSTMRIQQIVNDGNGQFYVSVL
jgi:hypothetical protein